MFESADGKSVAFAAGFTEPLQDGVFGFLIADFLIVSSMGGRSESLTTITSLWGDDHPAGRKATTDDIIGVSRLRTSKAESFTVIFL